MTVVKIKIQYFFELIAALILTVLAFMALSKSSNGASLAQTTGLVCFWIVGGRHMTVLGRSPWWGVFAATGLGAIVILFIPPKKTKPPLPPEAL